MLTHQISTQSPPPSLTTDNVDALPNGPYPIQDYLSHGNPSEAFHASHGSGKKSVERRHDMETRLMDMLARFNNNFLPHTMLLVKHLLNAEVVTRRLGSENVVVVAVVAVAISRGTGTPPTLSIPTSSFSFDLFFVR